MPPVDAAKLAAQSASQSTKTLQTVLEQIADLNRALLPLDYSIDLFFDQPQLHWYLQNLFDDYLYFCTVCLTQLQPQPQRKKFAVTFAILFTLALLFAKLSHARQPEILSYPLVLIVLSSCCLLPGGHYLYCTYERLSNAEQF